MRSRASPSSFATSTRTRSILARSAPEHVHLMWLEAVKDGDLDRVMALYEPESAIVDPSGELIAGSAGVRRVTEGLLSLHPHFELRVARVLQCGDVALLLSPWTMVGSVDGTAMHARGTTTDLVRRQPDGTWRFVIDNPTGIGILTAELTTDAAT